MNRQPTLSELIKKTIVVHTATYFVIGVFAYIAFDYATLLSQPPWSNLFRKLDHPLVAAGPLFQPIRGFLFALVFYPLREVLFGRNNGWLIMWWMLFIVGIVGTFGPTPCSLEGAIFTVIPLVDQILGMREVVLQSLLLSFILCFWVNHPEKKWLNWLLYGSFVIVLLLSTMGLYANLHK